MGARCTRDLLSRAIEVDSWELPSEWCRRGERNESATDSPSRPTPLPKYPTRTVNATLKQHACLSQEHPDSVFGVEASPTNVERHPMTVVGDSNTACQAGDDVAKRPGRLPG